MLKKLIRVNKVDPFGTSHNCTSSLTQIWIFK